MNTIDIGLNENARESVSEELKILLSDSYTLYLQTHNFHWNITGPSFIALHTLFEEHYNELAVAVDDIAERIRSLGFFAPGTYKQFNELCTFNEITGTPSAIDMVKILTQNHEAVIKTCRSALTVAQSYDDESSSALISDRMRIHEKTAWILRSQIS